MKKLKFTLIALSMLVMCGAQGANCPDGELSFSFDNINTLMAFAIIADYAGLKSNFDDSIKSSSPLKFGCTNWREAAENIANKHNLMLSIEGDVMHVSK